MTTTQRSRLSLLRLVLFGSIGVPTLAAATTGVNLFSAAALPAGPDMVYAPPPVTFVVLGVSMVAWAVGRRHLKSQADLRSADAEA